MAGKGHTNETSEETRQQACELDSGRWAGTQTKPLQNRAGTRLYAK